MLNTKPFLVFALIIMAMVVAACDSSPETTQDEEPTTEAVEQAVDEQEGDEAEQEEADQEATEEPSDPLAAPDDVAGPPDDAETTESGLAYKVLREGDGDEHPTETSTVSAHYTGWTTDGEMFDSSVERGEPTSFPLNRVIAGWTEGVQLMVEGEKTRFWIPEDLAYQGRPGSPQGMLVFDVELVEIE